MGKQPSCNILANARRILVMKTRNMMVPRSIIKQYLLHPEVYGESIVELDNGMVTDVYTDSKGFLFTITNDQDLIEYLLVQDTKEASIIIDFMPYSLKSIDRSDAPKIHEWFLISPLRRSNNIENDIEIVYEFISHAKSMDSNVFIFSKNTEDIGLIGFRIIDGTAFMSCDVFNKTNTSSLEIAKIIEQFLGILKSQFKLTAATISMYDFDLLLMEAISSSLFKEGIKSKHLVPTLSGYLIQYEYQVVL